MVFSVVWSAEIVERFVAVCEPRLLARGLLGVREGRAMPCSTLQLRRPPPARGPRANSVRGPGSLNGDQAHPTSGFPCRDPHRDESKVRPEPLAYGAGADESRGLFPINGEARTPVPWS